MLWRMLLVLLLCGGVAGGDIQSAARSAEVGKQTQVGKRLAQGFLAALAIATVAGYGWALSNRTIKAERIYLDRELRSLAGGADHVLGIEKGTAENYETYRQLIIPIELTTRNGVLVRYDTIHPAFYNGMLVHYKKLDKSYIGQVGVFDAKEREVALIRNHIDPKATRYRPHITVVDAGVVHVVAIEGVLVESFAAEEWSVSDLFSPDDNDRHILLHKGRQAFFRQEDAEVLGARSLYGYQLSELGDVIWGEERLIFSDGMHVIKVTKTGMEVENNDPNNIEVDWFDLKEEYPTFVIVNGANFHKYFDKLKNNKENDHEMYVHEDKIKNKNNQQEWVKFIHHRSVVKKTKNQD